MFVDHHALTTLVAFTPKGGCPLKHFLTLNVIRFIIRVAFTPKGGCPLKLVSDKPTVAVGTLDAVAFTPKGGCPLKLVDGSEKERTLSSSSIHPQGWVPIETRVSPVVALTTRRNNVAFTPKGGCPLKPSGCPTRKP